MSRIVIVGGHGKVALRLARLLAGRGDEVVSLVRNPDHTSDVEATGASARIADVEKLDEAALAELFGGFDAIVWSAGAGGGSPERTYAVDRDAAIRTMGAAESAGVRRYVMVSYFGAGPDHGVAPDNPFYAYADAKTVADAHLEATDLDWTIVRPSRLTDDPGTGRIETGPDATPGEVSRDDVAAVVAAVLADDGTVRRVIEFNGGDVAIEDALAAGR